MSYFFKNIFSVLENVSWSNYFTRYWLASYHPNFTRLFKFILSLVLSKLNESPESKQVIVKLVRQGVSTFDMNRVTCLTPDWSKDGMGFLLLQKYCTCAIDRAPVCCPEGWRLVFAGSRFCTDAEQKYAPIESEASAISWAPMLKSPFWWLRSQ